MNKMTSDKDERNEFSKDFKHFQRFFTRAWRTDGPTDRPTDNLRKKNKGDKSKDKS